MTLVDSHCHLDGKTFAADREAVVERARAAGVETMVAIGTGDGPPDLEAGLRLAAQYDFIFATVGVHPHDAAKAEDATYDEIRSLAGKSKVVALGEMGLDYHYNFAPPEVQRAVFIRQLAVAREVRLPVVIHTREAWEDTFAILSDHWPAEGPGGIMHCFSGGPREAEEALGLGFHLSFSGIVTYPKAVEVHEAARLCPEDRLLVETDAPYLAPVPHRGKRNEPAYVVRTAERLAELREESLEMVAAATTGNWRRLCLQGMSATK
ncbi:MAG: TatD family hydrolase [Bryobacteraceae bacterium]|nr:TatD family hydrolase [Solibacteraceae bacterium]MCO5349788.1 TatD family hydrolase [Bryobacteraceae bacterium]